MSIRLARTFSAALVAFLALLTSVAAAAALEPQLRGAVELTPCPIGATGDEMLCGSYEVFENRRGGSGRTVSLEIAVLPAKKRKPLADPVFFLSGGPGVHETMALCEIWPSGRPDRSFGDPVEGETPVLLWAGSLDSASRPEWAAEVTDNFPNSSLVVVEGGHTPEGSCVDKINRKFLKTASVERLKTGCTRKVKLPGFQIPG